MTVVQVELTDAAARWAREHADEVRRLVERAAARQGSPAPAWPSEEGRRRFVDDLRRRLTKPWTPEQLQENAAARAKLRELLPNLDVR